MKVERCYFCERYFAEKKVCERKIEGMDRYVCEDCEKKLDAEGIEKKMELTKSPCYNPIWIYQPYGGPTTGDNWWYDNTATTSCGFDCVVTA